MLTTFQNDKILNCFVTFNIQCSIFTLLNICSEESNCDNMFFKYKITFSDPPFKLSKPDKFDTWCWNSTPVLACPPECVRSVPGLGVKSSLRDRVSRESATDLAGDVTWTRGWNTGTGQNYLRLQTVEV